LHPASADGLNAWRRITDAEVVTLCVAPALNHQLGRPSCALVNHTA
jgi:hypothetical protein